MSMLTVKDGTEIYYKGWGTGQPIVFHHGWPLSGDDWDAQMMFKTVEEWQTGFISGFSSWDAYHRSSNHQCRPASFYPGLKVLLFCVTGKAISNSF